MPLFPVAIVGYCLTRYLGLLNVDQPSNLADGRKRGPRLRFGKVPEWFLAVAALVYASGFLVVFTSESIWGLQDIGLELFKIKYIHAGFLCNLPLLTLGVPAFGMYELMLASKPTRDSGNSEGVDSPREFSAHLPLLSAFLIFLVFLCASYMFVPRLRFETWVGSFVVIYTCLFLVFITVVRIFEEGRAASKREEKRYGYGSQRAEPIWWLEYLLLAISVGSIVFLLAIAGTRLSLEAFFGYGRATHSGMLVPLLMLWCMGLVLWRTIRLTEALKQSEGQKGHQHSHHKQRLWVWTVNLSTVFAFYCLYVLSFAYTVYPYIPVERGGASFVAARPVWITLLSHSESFAPHSLFDPESSNGLSLKPLDIIDETPAYLYVADPADASPVRWRRGEVPAIYELRRDFVGYISYSPPN